MIVTVIGKAAGAKPGVKIFTAHKSWGVEGSAVSEFWVNPNICMPQDIIIGKQYEVFCAKTKYVFHCKKINDENSSDIVLIENIDNDYLNSLIESEDPTSQAELSVHNAGISQ